MSESRPISCVGICNFIGMKLAKPLFIAVIFFLGSCIGTDVTDGPVSGDNLELTPKTESLLIGQSFMLSVSYINFLGETEEVMPDFHSLTPAIVSVGEDGTVTAIDLGVGKVYASYGMTNSDTVIVNVVGSENDIAEIIVSGDQINIDIGEETMLRANAYTVNEIPVVTTFFWSSENEEVATVNGEGLVTGVSKGFTTIKASADGVDGFYDISVGFGSAQATFMGSSGYTAKGTAELSLNDKDIILTLSDDFETSFALGTFVYLANTTAGAQVKAQGLEVSQITMNGSHTFNVTEIAENMGKTVSFGEYKYVVILCGPASLTFGYGELTL